MAYFRGFFVGLFLIFSSVIVLGSAIVFCNEPHTKGLAIIFAVAIVLWLRRK